MRIARFSFALILSVALLAEGTNPKPQPADYPVQASDGSTTIAADYGVRAFGSAEEAYWTPDYLIVEVALYSTSREPLKVSTGAFTLRLNGKKEALLAQSPSLVAASLKYPDWEYRPHMEARGGTADGGVIVGRPTPTERFPGDQTGRRLPAPPRAPDTQPRGVEKQTPKTPAEVAVERALPEGERVLPVSGYLYFPFKGKPKSLKSVELVYHGSGLALSLKLK